jgi:hypothetical protein
MEWEEEEEETKTTASKKSNQNQQQGFLKGRARHSSAVMGTCDHFLMAGHSFRHEE